MTTGADAAATSALTEPNDDGSAIGRLRRQIAFRNYTLLLVVVVTWLVFQVLTNGIFLSQRNLTLLALQTTITALAAISAVMLIVTRNIDLSVGSAVALVGVVVAWLTVRMDIDPLIAVPVAIATGIALGAWNGWWVTRIGVPSFIVTLAGLLTFRGISLIITNSATISPVPKSMTGFATGFLPAAMSIALVCLLFAGYALFQVADARRAKAFGLIARIGPRVARMLIPAAVGALIAIYVSSSNGLPLLVLMLGACALAAEVLMRRTRYGAQLYAIGGNPEAARLAGINIGRAIFWDFLIAGFAYGVTGVALTARVSGAVSGSAGLFLELDAITAAIIGGTSLAGGRGTILGALLGAALMGSLNNGMSLLGIGTAYQYTAGGLVLLVAVAIDVVGRRRGRGQL
ncbi:MAG: sugar ABC transporter permease [Candidatus Limnocylindrales bacterium]